MPVATFAGVFSSGWSDIPLAFSLKRMIWKESPGFIPRTNCRTVSFATSIGCPLMEPEQSTTKNISFGIMSSSATSTSGWRISMKCPPRSPFVVIRPASIRSDPDP